MSARDRGEPLCPYCKAYPLSWSGVNRRYHCDGCGISNIHETVVRQSAASRSAPNTAKRPPPTPITGSGEDIATDRYQGSQREDGTDDVVTVKYHVPKKHPNYIPTLVLSAPHLDFAKHRLRKQVENERRYGRDWLRVEGYRVLRIKLTDGRKIKVAVPPDYDRRELLNDVRRQLRKMEGP